MLVDRFGDAAILYSTTEKRTGEVWIDGREIFQKSFTLNALPSGKQQYSHGISNFGYLVSERLDWYDIADQRYHSGNMIYPDGNYIISSGANLTNYQIETSKEPNWPSRTKSVVYTMWYTKLT